MKRIICTVVNDLNYDQRMHRICRTLTKAGYQVILVGRKLSGSSELSKQIFEQRRLNCLFNKGKLFYLEYNLRLLIFLLFNAFDLVCSVDLDTLVPGYLASRIKRKVCIYDAHEYFQEVPEVVGRPLTKKIWDLVASTIIPRLTYCYTVGPELAEIFTKKYQTRFLTIRNVPEKGRLSGSATSEFPVTEKKILLYQGALNEGRGLEAAIEAVKHLENIEFWLAGEGDLSEQLRKYVIDLEVSEKVKFLGYLMPDALKQLTPMAYLGYNLLENKGLSYYYSLANKFFDYIHAEVPTLNPDFPEYKSINNQYQVSLLVNTISPETIISAIQSLEKDQERYQLLKSNCHTAAEVFNWEKEEEKLLEIYKQALP